MFIFVYVFFRWRFWNKLPDNIHKDGKLMANTAAFQLTTGLQSQELLYITFHNEVSQLVIYLSYSASHTHSGFLSLEIAFAEMYVPWVNFFLENHFLLCYCPDCSVFILPATSRK